MLPNQRTAYNFSIVFCKYTEVRRFLIDNLTIKLTIPSRITLSSEELGLFSMVYSTVFILFPMRKI
jgi:hypothetical protein